MDIRVSMNCQDENCAHCSGCDHDCHGRISHGPRSHEAVALLQAAREKARAATEATKRQAQP